MFSRNPVEWPEFVECFRNNIHSKVTFNSDIRIARLLRVFEGDAKKFMQSIQTNGDFYTTARKTLKRSFGYNLAVKHLFYPMKI